MRYSVPATGQYTYLYYTQVYRRVWFTRTQISNTQVQEYAPSVKNGEVCAKQVDNITWCDNINWPTQSSYRVHSMHTHSLQTQKRAVFITSTHNLPPFLHCSLTLFLTFRVGTLVRWPSLCYIAEWMCLRTCRESRESVAEGKLLNFHVDIRKKRDWLRSDPKEKIHSGWCAREFTAKEDTLLFPELPQMPLARQRRLDWLQSQHVCWC